jgi:hypothetical protein
MVIWQPIHIAGIVEKTSYLQGHIRRGVSPQTFQAGATWSYGLKLPVNSTKFLIFKAHRDSTINYWNEVPIGHVIEDMARPRPINTAKYHIAVKGCAVSLFFSQTIWNGAYLQPICRRRHPDLPFSNFNFQLSEITFRCPEEPVQIMSLDLVEVDKSKAFHPHSGKSLNNDTTNAAKPDDPYPEPREVGMVFLAPDGHGPLK